MGYEFFGEKIIFPSAPVPGINNDQSLNGIRHNTIISKIINRLYIFIKLVSVKDFFQKLSHF